MFNRNGFSLVALLVSLGILGILAVAFSQYVRQSLRTVEGIQKKGDVEDLRRWVRIGIDCTATVSGLPVPCNNGTAMAIKRGSGTALVKLPVGSSYTEVAGYALKSTCTATAKQWNVVYSPPSDTARTQWTALFDVPLTCP